MKSLIKIGLCCLWSLSYVYVQAQDSVEVEIDEKTKVIIIAEDKDALQKLKALDLNQIVRDALREVYSEEDKEVVYTYEVKEDTTNNNQVALKRIENTEKPKTNALMVEPSSTTEGLDITCDSDDKRMSFKQRKTSDKSFTFWAVDLGINNYLNENGQFPDENGAPSRLRTINSTYIGVGVYLRQNIGNSPISLQTGLLLDWYNFKFQGDNYITQGPESVVFGDYTEDFGENIEKAKLVVNYINIPLMLNLRFRDSEGNRTFNFGVGGYVGYRINSYSKINIERNEKDKDRDTFYLNNFRYGLEAQVGYRNILIFTKYDLNPLFNTDRGPELNAISFGIRI